MCELNLSDVEVVRACVGLGPQDTDPSPEVVADCLKLLDLCNEAEELARRAGAYFVVEDGDEQSLWFRLFAPDPKEPQYANWNCDSATA